MPTLILNSYDKKDRVHVNFQETKFPKTIESNRKHGKHRFFHKNIDCFHEQIDFFIGRNRFVHETIYFLMKKFICSKENRFFMEKMIF